MLLFPVAFCLTGLAAIYIALRVEFPRSVSLLTLVLLCGGTSLLWYTLFERSLIETMLFAAAAVASMFARPAAVDTAKPIRLSAWVGLALLPIGAAWLERASVQSVVAPAHWADLLLSARHGFLSFAPVTYIAACGTLLYARIDRVWAIVAVSLLLAAAIVVGATSPWPEHASFAGRGMTWTLAPLAPGLAYVLDVLRRRPAVALAPIVAAALFWNHLLMVQYTVGLLPKDEPISFARMVQGQADAYTRGAPIYPFAFPANVLFAWREGLPASRYDVLAAESRRTAWNLAMDPSVRRFLLEGWDAPGSDSAGPVWWIGGRRATLVLPLDVPRDRAMQIVVAARTRFEEPAVQADLTLEVNGREIGQFSPSATAPSESYFSVPATGFWRDGYNRLTIVSRGVHRVDPSDTRPPGAIARRVRSGVWPVAIYRLTIAPVN